jgi:acid phosphatase (class A)
MKSISSLLLAAAIGVLLTIVLLRAQDDVAPSTARGYLSTAEMPDVTRIAPPAPAPGDVRDQLDLATFRKTRALEGTPRWAMALSDNDVSTAGLMRAFSCSAGVVLSRDATPAVASFLARVGRDTSTAFNRLKNFYAGRKRPFLVESGPVCLPATGAARLANNPDYPSGHTALAYSAGLVLAELIPVHATEILLRAQAFGESRAICGVHNLSAVEAGRLVSQSVVAALHANEFFRADLAAAHDELMNTQATSPAAETCALEAETVKLRPY